MGTAARRRGAIVNAVKPLGMWRSWSMVVGTMIGSGVFLLPAVLAPYGSYSLAGWVIAGTGTLFVALMLGALAKRIPRIGGPYAYTREAFGDFAGFLIAWGYWISLWAGNAAVAIAFAGYTAVFLPGLGTAPLSGALASLAVLWLVTGINIAGVRTAGIVQLTTTILKIIPLIVIAFAGLVAGEVGAIPAMNPSGQPLPLLFASIAVLTMWAYVGVEAATIPAEHVQQPERTIPRALLAGTLTATIIYIAATFGVMAIIPPAELSTSTSPFADAATRLMGGVSGRLVAAGALISILGALNSLVLLSGQVPRAAALDRLLPRRFAALNARGAPAFSLILSGVLASALILMNYSGGLVAGFTAVALLSTLMALVPYAASASAELALQRRASRAGGTVKRGTAAVAAIALVFAVFAIIGSGWSTIGAGLLLGVVGALVYLQMVRSAKNIS